jgi:hypothetical protein
VSSKVRTLQLYIAEEAMDVLEYLCDPKVDLRFEVVPPLLAAAWIARWAHAPMTPGLSFLEDLSLRPLAVTLEGPPLEEITTYATKMQQTPEVIAAAVVTARGAQIAWMRRNGPLGKGIPTPPPPLAGA